MMRTALLGLVLGAAVAAPAAADELAPLRSVAVQDGGRVKPLDTYARESVRLITGKSHLKTPAGQQDPLRTVLLWLAHPERTGGEPLLKVEHADLRSELGLTDADGPRISLNSLRTRPQFIALLESARVKRDADRDGELTTAEEKAEELWRSVARLRDLVDRGGPRIVAVPAGDPPRWQTVLEARSSADPAVTTLKQAWLALLTAAANDGDIGQAALAVQSAQRTPEWTATIGEDTPALLVTENRYYALSPFTLAMWLYFLGAAAMAITLPVKSRVVLAATAGLVVLGFLVQGYGLWLRIQISGRPPVTNMYESIVWCGWSALLFAFILEGFQRIRLYAIGGALTAWLSMAFAGGGLMPLDTGISPLVPVLRNNFWLTIHVPIIVASYGAFALAWVMGHVAMGVATITPGNRDAFRKLSRYIYLALQIGVLLLAIGTILGGVWASYSWGRFWGWDPKEVGALLALLIYLAALHGRFAGWWHDFGLSVTAVMGFYGVLMAWVGVNMLGVGLHSYGFAKGGPLLTVLVAIFAADIAFCIWAYVARKAAEAAGKVPPPDPEPAKPAGDPPPAATGDLAPAGA